MTKIWTKPSYQEKEFFGMVTVSPQMTKVFSLIEKVAKTDASVLIRGDTGTGKELVARAIHELSLRRQNSFSAVNCASFSSELMASELFGHIKGAFTGATSDHKGLFEISHLGTLFLDEVAEIPIDIQARLLRVLQDGSFMPVGSTKQRRADVRLISATHTSLRDAALEGKFRQDLMYRIRVIPLFLPKLTEREGDIEVLIWKFIDEFSQGAVKGFTWQAKETLLSYSWPGNVRELRNVAEYISAMRKSDVIDFDDLPPDFNAPWSSKSSPQTLKSIERDAILTALASTHGHKGKAAKILEMDRTTLWRKLKEFGIL